jgi:4-hydroxy-2-oxoheptanedioate aldolase
MRFARLLAICVSIALLPTPLHAADPKPAQPAAQPESTPAQPAKEAAPAQPAPTAAPGTRLNRMIELWEQGKPAFGTFARFRDPDGALYYASTDLDFVIFDLEHGPADFTQLRVFLQFMVDKSRLLKKGNLQPNVVPLVRIPSNGGETNQWVVKQALDAGAFGMMAPHIANTEDALAVVSASRYAQRLEAKDQDPPGERGAAPTNAARYWGVSVAEYFERADLWPLDAKGELALIAMIESEAGVENAKEMLSDAKGIAAVFIGPTDLSTSLGYAGQPEHPEVEKAIQEVLAVTKELKIPCGILVTKGNIEKRVKEGFRFLVIGGTPGEVEEAVKMGRAVNGK